MSTKIMFPIKSKLSFSQNMKLCSQSNQFEYSQENVKSKVAKGSTPEFIIEGDSIEETNSQRITLFLHFALIFSNLFKISHEIESLNLILTITTIVLSIVLGDFGTGVFHWSVDNYGGIKTPIFGSVCVAFQGHHETPWTITFRPFANNVYKIAYATIPMLLIVAISPISTYLKLFLTLFINWWLLSQEFHKYAHMRQVPEVIKWLQDRNIILSRREHGLHHSSPFEGNYCILTGVCNSFLDKIQFFRYLERIIFQITGNKPNTWKIDPLIEQKAMNL